MMKRCAMEFVGTFFLTVAISLMANPIAVGLTLMAMIYAGGHISGAHFNPAVSFACLIQNRLSSHHMAKYILAQSLGALLALCFFSFVTEGSFTLDVIPGTPFVAPMLIEALLTMMFVWMYLNMNFGRYKDTVMPGIVLGLTLLAIASSYTGGLFNPAVGIASMVCSMFKDGSSAVMGSVMVYLVGPMLGGLGASFMYDYFKSEQDSFINR